MDCEKYKKLISDWLDGNITPQRKAKLAHHLQICKSCQTYYEELSLIHQQAKTLPEPEFLPQQWQQFEERLRAKLEQPAVPGEKSKGSFWRPLPRLAWGLGGILVLVALLIIFFWKGGQIPEMQLATMLSYEESYLSLSQVVDEDETLAWNFNEELINSIAQEIKLDEETIKPEFQNYQLQDINKNNQDSLLLENSHLTEGL
jgi:hypothetical protein